MIDNKSVFCDWGCRELSLTEDNSFGGGAVSETISDFDARDAASLPGQYG